MFLVWSRFSHLSTYPGSYRCEA